MGLKVLAIFAALCAIVHAAAPVAAIGQTGTNRPGASRPAPSVTVANPPSTEVTNSPAVSDAGTGDGRPAPHVTVATAAPAPRVQSWQEYVTWIANIVLAVVAYTGIWMFRSLLKKIERQTAFGEVAAEAAAKTAHAALLNAQSIIQSERPWILITVEPSRSAENSFTIMATNRGRTPARITEKTDRTRIAADERRLPRTPDYRTDAPEAPLVPITLVPGESTPIRVFGREEVKALCDSEERFKRIETWEEKVFIYGKVIYVDLISPADDQVHETNWCCWYIHGRQNSGLVIAGPAAYNAHT
ncbi:MAG: hypothetical protein ABSB60_15215 [Terracidiphilus sp.]|jgi:hypothetical protein